MIWVTWRQHRTLLVASGGLLALMLAVLFVTGLGISHTFHASGLATCLAVPTRDCGDLASAFFRGDFWQTQPRLATAGADIAGLWDFVAGDFAETGAE